MKRKKPGSKARSATLRKRSMASDITAAVAVFDVETRDQGRARRKKARREGTPTGSSDRLVTIGRIATGYRACTNPAVAIGKAISDALDPIKVPGKCKTLADMTPEERAEMARLYGNRIKKSDGDRGRS